MVGVFVVDENKYKAEIGFCFAGGVDTTWGEFGNIVGVSERRGSQRQEYVYTCGREVGSTGERRDHMFW